MKNYKKMLLIAACALLGSVLPIPAVRAASITIPDTAVTFNKHQYAIYNEENGITWTDAEKKCEAMGGHLVTITSQKEEDFIISLCNEQGSKYYYWMGAKKEGSAWTWVTKESWNYTYWSVDQPNNSGGGGYGLVQHFPNNETDCDWDDQNNTGNSPSYTWRSDPYYQITDSYGYICEWDRQEQSTTEVKEEIKNTVGDKDLSTSEYEFLQAKLLKRSSTALKITWKQIHSADGYIVYGRKCGKDYKYLRTIKNSATLTTTFRNLKKGTYYKFFVMAYKKTDSGTKIITVSKTVHAITKGGKYGNAKSVKIQKVGNVTNSAKITMTAGTKAAIKASSVKEDKPISNHRGMAYESTNKNIASVSSKGVIKAKNQGTCYIFVYAQDGIAKKLKITVS